MRQCGRAYTVTESSLLFFPTLSSYRPYLSLIWSSEGRGVWLASIVGWTKKSWAQYKDVGHSDKDIIHPNGVVGYPVDYPDVSRYRRTPPSIATTVNGCVVLMLC